MTKNSPKTQNTQQEQPETLHNFYAVIPAFVRRNKNLEYGAMMLYGDITALTKEEGYCYASNSYFCELFDVDERTIRRWLESLKGEGLIEVELYKIGMIQKRRIWIDAGFQKMFAERKKCHPNKKKTQSSSEIKIIYAAGQNCPARAEGTVRHGRSELSAIYNTSNIDTSIKRSKGDDETGQDFDSSISTLACASGDSIAAPPPLAQEVVDTPSQWDLKEMSGQAKAVIESESQWKAHFKPKTVKGWLQKHGGPETYYVINVILELIQNSKKPIENPEAYAEKLFKDHFFTKNKNALRNKDFAKKFRDHYKWNGLKINKKYCVVLDTNQDFSYDLPPETFDAGLKHAYSKYKSSRGE